MPAAGQAIAAIAAASAVSGALSSVTEGLPPLPSGVQTLLSGIGINPYPVLPGIWFGLVTGSMAWRWGSRAGLGAILALATTALAWQLAVQTGVAVFDRLAWLTQVEEPRLLMAGLVAGAVGALGTFLGLRLTIPFPRATIALVATVAVGTLFGGLLRWSMTRDGAGLLLYVLWQPAVAVTMAYFALQPPARRAPPT